MTDTTAAATGTGKPRHRFRDRMRNPVAVKELRSRMRGRRGFVILTLYLLLLSAAISFVYMVTAAGTTVPSSTVARTAGKGLFVAVLGVQVLLAVFIGPAFTAGSITGERERRTFDLVQTTLLTPHALVLGKLVSALSFIVLLVLVSIPLQSIAFLLGGLSAVELVLSESLVLIAAVAYALYGLWCSAVMRSTLASTVTTFAGALFVNFGIPLIALLGLFMAPTISMGAASVFSPLSEITLLYGGLTLAAVNLPATLIVSETFLLNEGTLTGYVETVAGRPVWLFSPWILFAILHVLAALVLYVAAVKRVGRVSEL